MRKHEAVKRFKETYMPHILKYEEEYGVDYPNRANNWRMFTDLLLMDGYITNHQWSTWCLPQICKR